MANSTAINSVSITTDSSYLPGATLTAVVDPPYAEVEYTWAILREKYQGAGYKTVNGESTFTRTIISGATTNTYVVGIEDAWCAVAVAVKGINSFSGIANRYVEILKPNLVHYGILALPENTVVPDNYSDPSVYNIDVDETSVINLYALYKDAKGVLQQTLIADANWFYDSVNDVRYFKLGSDGYPFSDNITCFQGSSPWTTSSYPTNILGEYLGGVFYGPATRNIPVYIPRSMREFETKCVTSANRLRLTANLATYYKSAVEESIEQGHVGDLYANLYSTQYSYPAVDATQLNFQWQIEDQQTGEWSNDPAHPTSTRYITPVQGNTYRCVITGNNGYYYKGSLISSPKSVAPSDTITSVALLNTTFDPPSFPVASVFVDNDQIALQAVAIISVIDGETITYNPLYLNFQWQISSDNSTFTDISGAIAENLNYHEYNSTNCNGKYFIRCVVETTDGLQTVASSSLEVFWRLAELSDRQGSISGTIPWGSFVSAYGRVSTLGSSYIALNSAANFGLSFKFYPDSSTETASATELPTAYSGTNYFVLPKRQVNNYFAIRTETLNDSLQLVPEQVITSNRIRVAQRDISGCTATFKTSTVALGDVVVIDSVADEIDSIDEQLGEQTEILNLVMGTDFDIVWYRKLADGDELVRVGSTSNSLTYQITAADIGNKIVAKLNGINAYRGNLQIETGVVASESQNVIIDKANINGTTSQSEGQTIERLYYAENSYGDYVKDDTTLACVTIRDKEGNVVYSKNNKHGIADNVTDEGCFQFQWYRTLLESNVADKSGLEIKGATDATYQITKADVGKYIGVKITGIAPDYSGEVFVYFQPKVETRTVRSQVVYDMADIIKAKRDTQIKFLMKKWDEDNPGGNKEDREEYEKDLKESSNEEIRLLYAMAKHVKAESRKTKVPAQKAPQGMFPT